MFVGHYAVAFGAKDAAPGLSLGTLFVAAQLPDIWHSALLVLGIERVTVHPGVVGPGAVGLDHVVYSHSLLATLALAAVTFVIAARLSGHTGAQARTVGLVMAATVASHYLLDIVSHPPDVPLIAGVRVGLTLGQDARGAFALEALLLLAGLALYLRRSTARDAIGTWGLAALVAGMVGFNWLVLAVLPPAEDVTVLAASNLAAYFLLAALAGWIDRHRVPTTSPPTRAET